MSSLISKREFIRYVQIPAISFWGVSYPQNHCRHQSRLQHILDLLHALGTNVLAQNNFQCFKQDGLPWPAVNGVKWLGYDLCKLGYNPSYLFKLPFIGVIVIAPSKPRHRALERHLFRFTFRCPLSCIPCRRPWVRYGMYLWMLPQGFQVSENFQQKTQQKTPEN